MQSCIRELIITRSYFHIMHNIRYWVVIRQALVVNSTAHEKCFNLDESMPPLTVFCAWQSYKRISTQDTRIEHFNNNCLISDDTLLYGQALSFTSSLVLLICVMLASYNVKTRCLELLRRESCWKSWIKDRKRVWGFFPKNKIIILIAM